MSEQALDDSGLLFAFHPGAGKDPVSRLRVWRRVMPGPHETREKRMHGSWSLQGGIFVPESPCEPLVIPAAGITRILQKSTPPRPARRAEGWLRRTPAGWGFCLFRKLLEATLMLRQQLSADRGHRLL